MGKSKNTLIIDSGFFIALGNSSDFHHKQAIRMMEKFSNKRWVTTWPVLTEVCHLLSRESLEAVIKFLQNFEDGAFEVFALVSEDAKKLKSLITRYKDLPMDLAEASLVLLAEALGHGEILSTDARDFLTYRWKKHQPFHNLFL